MHEIESFEVQIDNSTTPVAGETIHGRRRCFVKRVYYSKRFLIRKGWVFGNGKVQDLDHDADRTNEREPTVMKV